jgi:hypothetical protein
VAEIARGSFSRGTSAALLCSVSKTIAPSPLLTGTTTDGTKGVVETMTKALAEGTGSAGGYLVPIETAGEVLRPSCARARR